MKRFLLALLTLFGLCFLYGCSSSGSGSSIQPPPPATHFSVVAPANANAGTPFNITVTALDASNRQVGTYSGTVHFTSSDLNATLPGDQLLTNGTATLQVTLLSAGNQTITATDTLTASITGMSAITVTVLTATQFAVTAPGTALTGSPFNITVTAQDASNTQVPTYSGTVHFISSDPNAALPGDQTLTNGTATLQVNLFSAGNQTITATDTVTASITGKSAAINVMGPTHFSVTAPTNATAGSAFNFTVTALDAANAVVPAYSGTVRFTSSDSKADLPATQAMTSGTASFVAALKTPPSQTITVTDTVTAKPEPPRRRFRSQPLLRRTQCLL